MSELRATDITVAEGGARLLDGVSLAVRAGELVAVLGPNGAGKTTLLRAMLGLVACRAGRATLDGVPVRRVPPQARARRVAYLPQHRPLAWPSPVRDVVALGRYAYGAAPGRLASDDAQAVDDALAACDLTALADRPTDRLSGGELARVHLARAFAAHAALLLADEPVSALDPLHQWHIARRLRRFVDDGGGALVVLHDVDLAARLADRLVFLCDGRVVSDGPPATVTAALLGEVYGVRARIDREGTRIDIRIEAPL